MNPGGYNSDGDVGMKTNCYTKKKFVGPKPYPKMSIGLDLNSKKHPFFFAKKSFYPRKDTAKLQPLKKPLDHNF